jgi:hypothetical protein
MQKYLWEEYLGNIMRFGEEIDYGCMVTKWVNINKNLSTGCRLDVPLGCSQSCN